MFVEHPDKQRISGRKSLENSVMFASSIHTLHGFAVLVPYVWAWAKKLPERDKLFGNIRYFKNKEKIEPNCDNLIHVLTCM